MVHPLPLGLLAILASFLSLAAADAISVPFEDCFDEQDSLSQKLDVNSVFAQVLHNDDLGRYLNLTVIGTTPKDIVGLLNTSSSLSTLFTSTSVLTLSAWTNSSYLCQTMRPPSPLPPITSNDNTFCPIAAGPFAFSATIPWGRNRELTTLITRLRAVDPVGKELLCVDVNTTPLEPRASSPYGKAEIVFWSTIALTASYWVVVGLARISAAWSRGASRSGRGIWPKAQSAGYILASAVSGERFANTPALMRFCTPSMRDVIFHTQWCAVLAMVAVEWPQFVYPLLSQTAWATLAFNISLTESIRPHHWDPLNPGNFNIPNDYADQISDPQSPLFINSSVPNIIYSLPNNATHGIASFAYTIGLRPQDLFPTCLILFLGIMAGTIAISFLIWLIDYVFSLLTEAYGGNSNHGANLNRLTRAKSPGFGATREMDSTNVATLEESKSLTGASPHSGRFGNPKFSIPLGSAGLTSERGGINTHRSWWRIRTDIGAFHGSVLHGNLVRILVLFHLPVTIFSVYQMTSPRSQVGVSSVVLAALSFVIFSILIPAHLVIRVTFTTTNKLYDETKTLLSLGPLYNHYRHGSQLFATLFFATNIAFGITIGAGQKSGTAQAIVILVVEVISALVTSIWLPWGSGASMGLISFLFCVARIVIAVLLVILTQAISIGAGPDGWIAYGILIILAIVYLALLLMLIVKILEGLVRIVGRTGFDRSRHSVDTGLIGACGLAGCCGLQHRRHSRKQSRKRGAGVLNNLNPAMANTRDSDLSSYMPPAPGMLPRDGSSTPPRFLGTESRKGSTGSQGPPSVLKPEHANIPYREDPIESEDVNIMGAWQPFGRPAHNHGPTVETPTRITPPSTLSAPSSPTRPSSTPGFSRVGGGRARMDTPYAIATGSTHTFPSIEQTSRFPSPTTNRSTSALASQPLLYDTTSDSHEDIRLSLANVAGATPGIQDLPPGAMQPAHIRTKSQTAIVEDFLPMKVATSGTTAAIAAATAAAAAGTSASTLPSPSSLSTQNILLHRQPQPLSASSPQRYTHISEDSYLHPDGPPASSAARKFTLAAPDDDSGDEQDQQKKTKKWYHLRRNRPHSSEGRPSASTSTSDFAAVGGASGGLGASGTLHTGDSSGIGGSSFSFDPELGGLDSASGAQPQRSFVVIRKNQSSMTRLNQGGSSSSSGMAAGPGPSSFSQSNTFPRAGNTARPPTR